MVTAVPDVRYPHALVFQQLKTVFAPIAESVSPKTSVSAVKDILERNVTSQSASVLPQMKLPYVVEMVNVETKMNVDAILDGSVKIAQSQCALTHQQTNPTFALEMVSALSQIVANVRQVILTLNATFQFVSTILLLILNMSALEMVHVSITTTVAVTLAIQAPIVPSQFASESQPMIHPSALPTVSALVLINVNVPQVISERNVMYQPAMATQALTKIRYVPVVVTVLP